MSIFGKILGAIFGSSASATTTSAGSAPGSAAPAGGAAPSSLGTATASSSAAPAQSVDIAAIVDLMKALDIDSSLAARKELAKELGYTGDTNDSASMNVWLHKQVMAKLAANGGKLPPEIKH